MFVEVSLKKLATPIFSGSPQRTFNSPANAWSFLLNSTAHPFQAIIIRRGIQARGVKPTTCTSSQIISPSPVEIIVPLTCTDMVMLFHKWIW